MHILLQALPLIYVIALNINYQCSGHDIGGK